MARSSSSARTAQSPRATASAEKGSGNPLAAGWAAGGAGFGAAAGLAGGPGVAVAAGVVADLEDGAAGRRTGQASADGQQLGLAGRSLQPAGDQVDLVGQMPRRRPLEHLRRRRSGPQPLEPGVVAGTDEADGGELAAADDGDLATLGVWAGEDDLVGGGEGGGAAGLGEGAAEGLEAVAGGCPDRRGISVAAQR